MVCAECMKMCCLGGKNSVVKGLIWLDTMDRVEGCRTLFVVYFVAYVHIMVTSFC